MKPLSELLSDDPALPLLQTRVADGHGKLLPCERAEGEATLVALQVTDRSLLGTMALATGGLLAQRGWVRLLGADHNGIGLGAWNGLAGDTVLLPKPSGFLVVGFDRSGGFFVVNGGAMEFPLGDVGYFAPDSLAVEPLGMGYSEFVAWVVSSAAEPFFAPWQFDGWVEETAVLREDEVFGMYPPPWSAEGKDVNAVHRGVVTARETWAVMFQVRSGFKTPEA